MPPNALPTLHDCLAAAAWRHLLAIAASLGLPRSTRWRKADLVADLHARLSQTDLLRQIVAGLTLPAQAALRALLAADGTLPAIAFAAHYGTPRPYRPWRGEAGEPWRTPASPAERLWYLGLLHFRPPRPTAGAIQQAILPADLLAPLRELLPSAATERPLTLRPRPGHPPDPAWHVALLLAAVTAAPLTPLAGHWLPPTALTAWAERTGLTQDPGYLRRRSERDQPYLAFLHLLAEAAELLTGGAVFGVTPVGWQWLSEPPAARLAMLWQAWRRAAAADLAHPYRFPWAAFTSKAHALVLAEVARLPLDHFTPLAHVVEQARLHDPYGFLARSWGEHEDPVAALVSGPLFWLGLVDVADPDTPATATRPRPTDLGAAAEPDDLADGRWPMADSRPADLDSDDEPDDLADGRWPMADSRPAVFDMDDEPVQSSMPETAGTLRERMADLELDEPIQSAMPETAGHAVRNLQSAICNLQSAMVRLTPVGAWLLGLPDWGAPPEPAPQPCTVSAGDPDLLLIPPTASPLHLARLTPFAEWQPPAFPVLAQRLRLTSERVAAAVAAGLPVPQLLHHLAAALGQPASRRLATRLRDWARAGQQVRVRPLLVLETTDPALMGRLRSRKLIRRRLGDALSPTRTALDPASLPAVVQHLRTLGLYPTIECQAWAVDDKRQIADDPSQSTAPQSTTPPIPLSPADAGLLLMAGLAYRRLGEHLPLPTPLSPDVLDRLAAALPTAQTVAARHAADQLAESLAAALRGYLGLPFWQTDDPAADPLPLIEQAIAAKQDLVITYHGAGREQAVVRRVTPYWLERRDGVPYLIAYCHLRGAERVFRVDRITECRPVTG
jgi:hypothetical protein